MGQKPDVRGTDKNGRRVVIARDGRIITVAIVDVSGGFLSRLFGARTRVETKDYKPDGRMVHRTHLLREDAGALNIRLWTAGYGRMDVKRPPPSLVARCVEFVLG